MYILFSRVDDKTRGPIEVKGRWLTYDVGYIPNTHVDIIPFKHLNVTVLPDDTALGWPYAEAWNNKLSIRGNTLQASRLNHIDQVSSLESSDDKTKVDIGAEDLACGVLFFKAAMRKIIDDIYNSRFSKLVDTPFEMSTWATQQAEATAGSGPLLTTLAAARSITVSEMAIIILNAASIYNTTIATLLASKQTIEGEIKACATISDCWVIMHTRLETHMPGPLATSLSIESEPLFNV